MFGLMRVRTHDAEMAKVRAAEQEAGRSAWFWKEQHDLMLDHARKFASERDTLQARLDALTPARREDGRFVAKARRLQPASPPAGTTGYGLEDFA